MTGRTRSRPRSPSVAMRRPCRRTCTSPRRRFCRPTSRPDHRVPRNAISAARSSAPGSEPALRLGLLGLCALSREASLVRLEVSDLPLLAQRLGVLEGAMLEHALGEPKRADPVGEAPDVTDDVEQPLAPRRVVHLLDLRDVSVDRK